MDMQSTKPSTANIFFTLPSLSILYTVFISGITGISLIPFSAYALFIRGRAVVSISFSDIKPFIHTSLGSPGKPSISSGSWTSGSAGGAGVRSTGGVPDDVPAYKIPFLSMTIQWISSSSAS